MMLSRDDEPVVVNMTEQTTKKAEQLNNSGNSNDSNDSNNNGNTNGSSTRLANFLRSTPLRVLHRRPSQTSVTDVSSSCCSLDGGSKRQERRNSSSSFTSLGNDCSAVPPSLLSLSPSPRSKNKKSIKASMSPKQAGPEKKLVSKQQTAPVPPPPPPPPRRAESPAPARAGARSSSVPCKQPRPRGDVHVLTGSTTTTKQKDDNTKGSSQKNSKKSKSSKTDKTCDAPSSPRRASGGEGRPPSSPSKSSSSKDKSSKKSKKSSSSSKKQQTSPQPPAPPARREAPPKRLSNESSFSSLATPTPAAAAAAPASRSVDATTDRSPKCPARSVSVPRRRSCSHAVKAAGSQEAEPMAAPPVISRTNSSSGAEDLESVVSAMSDGFGTATLGGMTSATTTTAGRLAAISIPTFQDLVTVDHTWEMMRQQVPDYPDQLGEQIILNLMEAVPTARRDMNIQSVRSQRFGELSHALVSIINLLVSLMGPDMMQDEFTNELQEVGQQCLDEGVCMSELGRAVSRAMEFVVSSNNNNEMNNNNNNNDDDNRSKASGGGYGLFSSSSFALLTVDQVQAWKTSIDFAANKMMEAVLACDDEEEEEEEEEQEEQEQDTEPEAGAAPALPVAAVPSSSAASVATASSKKSSSSKDKDNNNKTSTSHKKNKKKKSSSSTNKTSSTGNRRSRSSSMSSS